MPYLTIYSSSFSSLFYNDKAIMHDACTTGLTFLSMLLWFSKSLNLPTPEKHSGYISLSSDLLLILGLWCMSLSEWMYLLHLLPFSCVTMVSISASIQLFVTSYTSCSSHSEKNFNLVVSGLTYPFSLDVMVSSAGIVC